MANIKNELNNIKSALYGKDVRGSIHDGIDAINKEVENTTGRQVDLESTFDQLVINAGNSNAEIVDARVKSDGTSYSKLGDRLNEVDSQLAHKATKGEDIPINVVDFGVKPKSDATETTEKIQYCLDNFSKVFIPKGIYYVDKTLVVRDNSQLILEGENVRQINSNGAFLCPIENINVVELGGDNSSIIGGGISTSYMSNYDKSLILIDFSNKNRINNKITTSLFGKKTCYGVYIFGDGDGGEGFNLKIENFIDNCGVGIKGDKISGSCWFTVIYIDSYIQNCIQAIATNIGAGGKISGTMQPIIDKQNANSEERALVEIGTGYFYIDAFFWDSNTALNKYDIHLKKGTLNQRILSANARIKNENKYPYNKTNTNIDPFTTSIYPTKQFLLTKSFAGMQDNLLFGANKKFTVNVTKNNDSLYIGEKNNCFSGSGVHTNIQIPSSKPQDEDYIVSYEIIFDKLRHYHCMGFAFQGGYYPCYYRMYRKVDGEYELLQEGNPNDFLLEGKDAWSHHVPIVHNQPSSKESAFVEGVKFEFTLNPSIDGKSYCRLTSLFYKDGTTENYLPSHGGKVYGDVTHVQGTGTVLSSPNGNNYRLIVNDDGTLSTKKI